MEKVLRDCGVGCYDLHFFCPIPAVPAAGIFLAALALLVQMLMSRSGRLNCKRCPSLDLGIREMSCYDQHF